MINGEYIKKDPELAAQLEAVIINRDERIAGLVAERKALQGKLLEYISATDIQTICTKAAKETSCH